MKKMMSSAQAIVDGLIRHGVKTVFGIPGVHTYALFDALYERRAEISFIVSRHEQGAAYMAYGYARATGEVGVYTCVPGPGVLNTTAALSTAYAANAPVLCLTSEIPSHEIGRGHGILHELPDQLGLLRTLTKWSERIRHPAEAPRIVAHAFGQLRGGRPRPVALECPWDTLGQRALVELEVPATTPEVPAADPEQIQKAAELLSRSSHPMIMAGSGAVRAGTEVAELAQLLQAPVMSHRGGRGIVADDSPYGFDLGAAFEPWQRCDVLLAIGSRMELQYVRWKKLPPGLKVVRIDIDPEEVFRRPADLAIVADAAESSRLLIEALRTAGVERPSRTAEFALIKARAREKAERIQPQVSYLDVIRHALPRDGLFVEEISQVGFTARFGFPVFAPRTYIGSGYQENLGFGFMTALGVKAAFPDRPVVSISGDGGFMFGVQELATAVQHGINLVAIVFNNGSFGNVLRDQQQSYGGRVIGATLQNPDFKALGDAFGAAAFRVDSPQGLREVLPKSLVAGKPALIEVQLARGSESSPWPILHPDG
jgi:acetolactate synthase I/II/III large subunit